MFHSARIRLTAWYLAIIMAVSLSFSAVIFRQISNEVERFARMQRLRFEHRFPGEFIIPQLDADDELVEEVRSRLLIRLAIINGSILLAAGGLGYILAGRTLRPISDMVDEQNRFISDASHELRTPLTALKSSIEVSLRDRRLTLPEARKLLKDSIDDVDQLQHLSDELLQLAQYQGANGNDEFETVSLDTVLTRSINRIAPLARKSDITLDKHLGDLHTLGNRGNLEKVFVILLDNAVKYSPSGSTIEIEGHRAKGWNLVSITDTGIGIDAADLPHIFDRFYRADKARQKESASGYGLGLSIARKIVTQHHGTIQVLSKPGKETRFTVFLPVAP
jgi:two-component system, OmpR family, sensor histidine kinase CiaH